jgi:methionine-rich copper-binding protein CopC
MLHFSEPVRLTALVVTRTGEAKRELGPLPTERLKDFAVASPGLQKGQYTVSWRALSQDAHVMTGEFTFAVSEAVAAGAAHEGHSAPAQHAEHGAH